MTNEQYLEMAISEACVSLFQDYSLPLQRSTVNSVGNDPDLLYCGVVGCSGAEIRGSLLLATTREPLGRTAPISDASQREWIAELTNQLMGRIKNKLTTRGQVLHMSTPIVLRGQHLAPIPRAEIIPLVFTCEGGVVCVWFDAELAPGLDLSHEVEPEGLIPEGGSLLF
jgi:Chemotaxis phosphatase CheX